VYLHIDAVNPVPETRSGWKHHAERCRSVFWKPQSRMNRSMADLTARVPDTTGQVVPTWSEVVDADYAGEGRAVSTGLISPEPASTL
jgi:hypothetical protein